MRERHRRILREMLYLNVELMSRPGLRPREFERLLRAYNRTRALARALGITLDDA